MACDPELTRRLAALGYFAPGTAPDPTVLERVLAFFALQLALGLTAGVALGIVGSLVLGVRAWSRSRVA